MLVTRASRGIGVEIAKLAGRSEYNVGVNYNRSRDAAEAVAYAVRRAGG